MTPPYPFKGVCLPSKVSYKRGKVQYPLGVALVSYRHSCPSSHTAVKTKGSVTWPLTMLLITTEHY
jgi:hypothetical protein